MSTPNDSRPTKPAPVMVLPWAAGTGSVPRWLCDDIDVALAGVDVGDRSVWQLRQAVLSIIGPAEQVPEATRGKLAAGPGPLVLTPGEQDLSDRIVARTRQAIGEALPARLGEVLAAADRIAADEQREHERITERERQRQAIASEAGLLAQEFEDLARYERGRQLAAGALAREVQNMVAEDSSAYVNVERLADQIGVSVTELIGYADQVDSSSGVPFRSMSNATLAGLHLGYGPGGHEAVDVEFWGRFPALGGWYHAYAALVTPDDDDFDPLADNPVSDPKPRSADAETLYRRYKQAVERIALTTRSAG